MPANVTETRVQQPGANGAAPRASAPPAPSRARLEALHIEWEQPYSRTGHVTFWLLLGLAAAAVALAYVAQVQVYAVGTGRLVPRGEIFTLKAPAAGRVLEARFEPWAEVEENQVLYVLDTLNADPASSEMELATRRAQLEEARRAAAAAAAEEAQRRQELAQKEQLRQVGAVAAGDYEKARLALQQAVESRYQAEARVQAAEAALRQAEHQRRLEVRSPLRGRLARVLALRPGDMVSYGETMAEVVPQGTTMVFTARLPESERPKVKSGARAEVAWNGYPRQRYGTSAGVVTAIAPITQVQEQAGAVYEVEVMLERLTLPTAEGDRPLMAGMQGEVRIISGQRRALELLWDWIRGANPWE